MLCIYEVPGHEAKYVVLERLARICCSRKGSWYYVGDFNEIRNNNEKLGGLRYS